MPNPVITTLFAGDVVEEFMQLAVTQNQVVDGGHIYVSADIKKQRSMQRLTMSEIIQDAKATPISKGTFTVDNRILAPDDFEVYIEFDPHEFRDFWPFAQETTPFVFSQLPPAAQVAFVEELLKGEEGVNPYMGKAIFQGDKTSGTVPLEKFDGLFVKSVADGDVIDVAGTTVTVGNVIAEIGKVYDASPVELRENPDYKIMTTVPIWELYQDAVIALANKGPAPTDEVRKRFKGKTIVPLVGMGTGNKMIATHSAPNRSSNIWLGLTATNDFDTININRLQNNSDLWFFRMKMGADTQIKWGQRYVNYTD